MNGWLDNNLPALPDEHVLMSPADVAHSFAVGDFEPRTVMAMPFPQLATIRFIALHFFLRLPCRHSGMYSAIYNRYPSGSLARALRFLMASEVMDRPLAISSRRSLNSEPVGQSSVSLWGVWHRAHSIKILDLYLSDDSIAHSIPKLNGWASNDPLGY